MTIVVADAFLCLKFWLAVYVGKILFSEMRIERYGRELYFHVRLVVTIYLFLYFIDMVFRVFPADIRYGFRSTQLFYSHPTVFVGCCVFLIMILLAIQNYVEGYKKWLVILLLLMCSTLRSKAFGSAFAIIMICYFVFYRKKRFRLRTLLMFAPLVIILGWGQIEYYFFSSIQSGSARYQLLVTSLAIMKDYFPIGTGFGTFASYYSGVNYSPVYRLYGLTKIQGLMEGATSFVSDSFWPMIFGQTGVLGTVTYSFAIIALMKQIQGIRKISIAYYASALCGLCHLLISSMAESAFVHPLAIPIAIIIGMLIGQRKPEI